MASDFWSNQTLRDIYIRIASGGGAHIENGIVGGEKNYSVFACDMARFESIRFATRNGCKNVNARVYNWIT